MIRAFHQKNTDEALTIQKEVNKIVALMLSTGSPISGGKAIMKMSGIDCGPCRLPISTISSGQETDLQNELEKIGYFEIQNQ